MGTLEVGSVSVRIPVPIIQDHPEGIGGRDVGPVEQHGALVNVRMPGQDHINPVILQNRHHHFTHLDQLVLKVAVMGAL